MTHRRAAPLVLALSLFLAFLATPGASQCPYFDGGPSVIATGCTATGHTFRITQNLQPYNTCGAPLPGHPYVVAIDSVTGISQVVFWGGCASWNASAGVYGGTFSSEFTLLESQFPAGSTVSLNLWIDPVGSGGSYLCSAGAGSFVVPASNAFGTPSFKQFDSAWGKKKLLGTMLGETLASHGCYLACIAMLLADAGVPVTPGSLNDALVAMNKGYSGSYILPEQAVQAVASNLMFVSKPSMSPNDIAQVLCTGRPVCVEVTYEADCAAPKCPHDKCHEGSHHHFVVITGSDGAGDYFIHDPGPPKCKSWGGSMAGQPVGKLFADYGASHWSSRGYVATVPGSGSFAAAPSSDPITVIAASGASGFFVRAPDGSVTGYDLATGLALTGIPSSMDVVEGISNDLTAEPPGSWLHSIAITDAVSGWYELSGSALGADLVTAEMFSLTSAGIPTFAESAILGSKKQMLGNGEAFTLHVDLDSEVGSASLGEVASTVPTDFGSLGMLLDKGRIVDSAMPAKDALMLRGKMKKVVGDAFDPASEGVTIAVGKAPPALTIHVPAGDPGWSTGNGPVAKWKSPVGTLPKVLLTLDRKSGAFSIHAGGFDFAVPMEESVRLHVELGDQTGVDVRKWKPKNGGVLTIP